MRKWVRPTSSCEWCRPRKNRHCLIRKSQTSRTGTRPSRSLQRWVQRPNLISCCWPSKGLKKREMKASRTRERNWWSSTSRRRRTCGTTIGSKSKTSRSRWKYKISWRSKKKSWCSIDWWWSRSKEKRKAWNWVYSTKSRRSLASLSKRSKRPRRTKTSAFCKKNWKNTVRISKIGISTTPSTQRSSSQVWLSSRSSHRFWTSQSNLRIKTQSSSCSTPRVKSAVLSTWTHIKNHSSSPIKLTILNWPTWFSPTSANTRPRHSSENPISKRSISPTWTCSGRRPTNRYSGDSTSSWSRRTARRTSNSRRDCRMFSAATWWTWWRSTAWSRREGRSWRRVCWGSWRRSCCRCTGSKWGSSTSSTFKTTTWVYLCDNLL